MSYAGLIVGGMIAAIALVVWFKWHKTMTSGEEFGVLPKKARDREENASLEDFVAAYRRGEVSLKQESGPSHAPVAAVPAAPAEAQPGRIEPALPARRDPFLSGATKLAYYVCKSGLRDHHVFAHVRMQSVCTGKLDAQLAESEISLLVCNAGMSIVAAIDVIGTEPASADAAKAETLRSLGIRYLKLSPKSLPKPEEIRTLLYRM
jgi:hypothetical protein